MRIITYSDLHLEFGTDFMPLSDSCADLMILAGDIITFKNYRPLSRFLEGWNKPILYIAGNHEYYSNTPIARENALFKSWLANHQPNLIFLQDESVAIDGVNFYGGTMWTNFNGGDSVAMDRAHRGMNDYRYICVSEGKLLRPADTMIFHEHYVRKLVDWFEQDLSGLRVVISHHAPVVNPATQYGNSELMPAFNSLDMVPIIKKYQPTLWVYGHTHECDDQIIGNTRIISNQRGYPREFAYECEGFDEAGLMIEL